jgi:hypothetical protein
MNNQSYSATIEVARSPKDVFSHIVDVSKWWGGEDLKGQSAKLNDEFIIEHVGAHYSKQKLIEVIQNKKVVWLVTESHLDWLENNKEEWANTKLVFEITPKGDMTELKFTHEGLVPGMECYERCSEGWGTVIKDYLFNFIITGKPHFITS